MQDPSPPKTKEHVPPIIVPKGLGFPRSLAVAADDLDLIGCHRLRVIHLEGNVFDQKGPHFVAETVGVKMALFAMVG